MLNGKDLNSCVLIVNVLQQTKEDLVRERDFTPPSFSLPHSNYGISESFMLNITPPPIRVRKEEWEEKIQYTPSQPDMLQPHHAPAFMLQMARTGSTKSKILLE